MAEKIAAMPTPTSIENIRNVVLIGPSGSGKTTLIENLLLSAGAINRTGSVEDGSTVSDFDESEKKQQRSTSMSVAAFDFQNVRINLIDTPGFVDFAGEVRAGLRAADAALFVIPAKTGFDGNTKLLWQECERIKMPRAIVITKIDAPDVSIANRVEELRAVLEMQ